MEVIKWLSVGDRYTKMHLDRQLSLLGINSSQHMYITAICKSPGITQDRFLQQFYVNPSNITRSLAFLEKEGFIRKEIHPEDKRTSRLYPTSKAIDACETIKDIVERWEALLLEGMDKQQICQFKKQLEQVALRAVSLQAKDLLSEDIIPILSNESSDRKI